LVEDDKKAVVVCACIDFGEQGDRRSKGEREVLNIGCFLAGVGENLTNIVERRTPLIAACFFLGKILFL